MFRAFSGAVASLILLVTAAQAQPAPAQLSAESFTRNPAIWSASISPDGNSVAAIQESALGDVVTIIDWRTRVARATQLARRDRSLHLDWVAWKSDDRIVFSLRQEPVGRVPGTTRVFSANRDGTSPVLMQRLDDTYAPIVLLDILKDDPAHILLATYAQHGYTAYRAEVASGRVNEIVDYADWDTTEMLVDGQGYPVLRIDQLTDNSGFQIYRRAPGQHDWILAHEVRRAAAFSENRDFAALGAGPGPGQVYVAARPEGREFQAIYLYNTATGQLGEPVFAHDGADASVAWLDPNDHSVVVGCGETRRWQCRALRPGVQRHLDGLRAFFGPDVDIGLVDLSRDEHYWLLAATGPTLPLSYYVYDSTAANVSFVASTQPSLPSEALAATSIVEYAGRDGAPLWGYLTSPAGAGPHPLVVMPHGGPEARDSYGYEFFVQFLASRGYAVFQPNFRGSEGSGRTFVNAGHRQWGRRMQDDVTDGVTHLIESGAADRNRICIVGASYGGYAALAGATLTPNLYRCAISIAGVSDLLGMLAVERHNGGGRGSALYSYWSALIGDPDQDREELISVSPARQASRASAPILLIHGSEDPIVPYAQSETMRDALQEAGKPVELIRLEGEGHIWSDWRREDRQRLLEETDRFLSQHLQH